MSWSPGDRVDHAFWARRAARPAGFAALRVGAEDRASVVVLGRFADAPMLTFGTAAAICPCCHRPFADPPPVPDPAAPG